MAARPGMATRPGMFIRQGMPARTGLPIQLRMLARLKSRLQLGQRIPRRKPTRLEVTPGVELRSKVAQIGGQSGQPARIDRLC